MEKDPIASTSADVMGGWGERARDCHWCARVSLIQRMMVLIQIILHPEDDPTGVLAIWWEKQLALHKRRQRSDMGSKAETSAFHQNCSRWSPWVRAQTATRVTEIQIQPTQETNEPAAEYKIRSVDVSNCRMSHMNSPLFKIHHLDVCTLEKRLKPVFFSTFDDQHDSKWSHERLKWM